MKFDILTKTATKVVMKTKKHSPEILLAMGVAGIIVATVKACNASRHVDDVIEDHNDALTEIKDAEEEKGFVDIQQHRKDVAFAYGNTAIKFVKLYGPSVAIGGASLLLIFKSHDILRKRNIALAAAYKAVDEAFKQYRKRVIDELGEVKDRHFRFGTTEEVAKITETGEDGKTKTVKVKGEAVDPEVNPLNRYSQYAKYFDESCKAWEKDAEYNMTFLRIQQQNANDLLNSRGHVFLNEVYDMLGIPHTKAGAVVGWIKGGDGDNYIDFGIYDIWDSTKRDFVNGYEKVIILDFNVDGVIWDKI